MWRKGWEKFTGSDHPHGPWGVSHLEKWTKVGLNTAKMANNRVFSSFDPQNGVSTPHNVKEQLMGGLGAGSGP